MANPLYTPPRVMDGSEFNQPQQTQPVPPMSPAAAQPQAIQPMDDMDAEIDRIMSMDDSAFEQATPEDDAVIDAILAETEGTPEAGESIIGNDKTAGFITGVVNDSFSASAATTIESKQPSWLPSRLTFLDKEGNFNPDLKTVPEAIGILDEEWDAMSSKDRRILISKTSKDRVAEYFNADTESAGYILSNAAGMFVDPTTFFPMVGASVKAKAAFSAAVGGADMAMWETAHTGAPTLSGTGLGLALGGAVGAGVAKLTQRSQKAATVKTANAAGAKLEQYQKVLADEMSRTDDPIAAMTAAHKKAGVSFSEMGQTIRDSRSHLTQHMPADRIRDDWVKGWDEIFEPIGEHVKAMSPRIHKEWTHMERGIFETNNKYMMMVDEFLTNPKKISLDNLKKSKPEVFNSIKEAMLNNDRASLMPLIKQHMGKSGLKAFEDYQSATKDAYKLMSQHRGGKNAPLAKELDIFAHRVVKDFDMFNAGLAKVKNLNGISGKVHMEHIDKILRTRAKKLGVDTLTTEQKASVYSDYFNGFYDTKKLIRTPSGAKHRYIKQLPKEVMPAMHDPLESMHTYFKTITEDAHRKAFFGKNIVNKNGDDIAASIGDLVAKEHAAGRLAEKDIPALKNLLDLRWNQAVKAPPAAFQWMKDLGYSILLGNPIAAIVQLGDIALAVTQYGFRDTMGGLFDAIRKRGYTPEEAGLMNTAFAELASSGKTKLFGSKLGEHWYNPSTKNILRRSLALDIPGINKIPGIGKTITVGGMDLNLMSAMSFKGIDRVGKATNMNASLRSGRRAVKSPKGIMKLKAKWGDTMDEADFNQFVKDLKAGNLSDDVKTMIFSDLSNIQPISLLQLPKAYSLHPKGRLAYMLRTFQLKYMNLLRQNVYYQMKAGNTKAAIKNSAVLMGMFTAGGASTTMLKQFMLGRDVYPQDIMWDTFLKQSGIFDRYTLSQVSTDKDPLKPIVSNMLPPVNVFSPVVQAAINLSQGNIKGIDTNGLMKLVPIMGGLYENYFMGGLEDYNRKQRINKRRRN